METPLNRSEAPHTHDSVISMDPQLESAFERLLDDKNTQIEALNNHILQLNKRQKMQQAHIEIVEQQWQLSNNKLETLLNEQAQITPSTSPELTKLEQENIELTNQLEELQMSHKVLHHHCRDLSERNQHLHQTLKISEEQQHKINTLFNKQAADLMHLKNDFDKANQLNQQYEAQLRRYKEENKMLMGNYYDGVMNKTKKLSKNLPN
ncbi:hypothetical protein PULV_b0612 [Pseudoalteromonas ulvae UL12]|uniref:hypothetical protein n=1 Tax=Pseudoalteromonas ulvae TaxID=107327 RepID=UPI00186B9618|nr:hypothetical protein [Pseudoalteromonas ulvae]MBE0365914.1 hypothetical protein [Pseudoalteromonas ulvae UL12]